MIRVASIPADHPYVEHIQELDEPAARVLPEIFHEPGRWWPPRRLDPSWLTAHAHEFDLLHGHFGYESLTIEQLQRSLATLRRLGKPLVLTVHDLQNPHLADDERHHAQLAMLVAQAVEIVTLTPGAAREIRERWGRSARVVAHPHVVPLDQVAGTGATGNRVGVHLGDLRERVDVAPIAADLRRIAQRYPVTIDVQPHAWHEAAPQTRQAVESIGADELRVRDRLPDDELFAEVRRTRVQVLPYRRGTHSGWLEMCLDLGVAVAAPAVGYLREQHPRHPAVRGYESSEHGSLQSAVMQLVDSRPQQAGWPAFRRAQREQVASAYAEVYRSAMAGAR